MKARQFEIPLSETLNIIQTGFVYNNKEERKQLYDMFKKIALAAYKLPLLETVELKQGSVVEFGNVFELMCYGQDLK